MKKLGLIFFIVGVAVTLSSCMSTYEVKPDMPKATVGVFKLNHPRLCVDHQYYDLNMNEEHEAVIPAGRRITIDANYSLALIGYTKICDPSVSFIPRPGGHYFIDFKVIPGACAIQVLRGTKAKSNNADMKIEPTMAPGQDCDF